MKPTMTLTEAVEILGTAINKWQLHLIINSLESRPEINTAYEKKRLQAARTLFKNYRLFA